MRSLLELTPGGISYVLNLISILLMVGSLATAFRTFPEERRKSVKLLSLIHLILSFLIFLILMDCSLYERGLSYSYRYFPVQTFLFDLPWFLYVFLELFSLLLMIQLAENHRRFRKAYLTADSIRQALNILPEGILISDSLGNVWLTNLQMGSLCRDLTGEILANAERFWSVLRENDLGNADGPLVRIRNEVWLFERSVITVQGQDYFQTIAENVTEWYRIIEELNDKSSHLKEIQRRMKEAADLSADMFVAQEQANARVALHNQLGQVLLMGRHYLLHPDSSDPDLVHAATTEMNRFLMGEKKQNAEIRSDSLPYAISLAGSIGVSVKTEGKIPEDPVVLELIGRVITECAANTVKHAAGDTVKLEFTEEESFCCFRVTNNGRPPKREIAESGGLLALRKKIEEMGGTMQVEWAPTFVLTIRVGK